MDFLDQARKESFSGCSWELVVTEPKSLNALKDNGWLWTGDILGSRVTLVTSVT